MKKERKMLAAEQKQKKLEKYSELLGINKEYDRLYYSYLESTNYENEESLSEETVLNSLKMFGAIVSNISVQDFSVISAYLFLDKRLKYIAKKHIFDIFEFERNCDDNFKALKGKMVNWKDSNLIF